MESAVSQSGDLHFKIEFNDDSYSDQPLKVVDRGDLTYQEFIGILENVYGLQPGSITGMTYVDQDFDEVAVGSNDEFKQLLKSAHRWCLDNQYCRLHITTHADLSEEFENIGSVTGSDITDLGSVQMEVLNKVNDMDRKLKPLLSAQSEPPAWFQQYMAQFKGEILQEVQGLIQKQPTEKMTRSKPKHHHQTDVVHEKKNEKNDIHRKIEKFTRKERKIQQKMSRKNDLSKLLKLNIRLRNINTEKNQLISSLSEEEKQQWKVSVQGSSKMHRMDVKEIQDNDRMCITVRPGVSFEYTWTVINCGQSPWTEDTKLSLMSCSQGFEPPKSTVQCPFLEPGDIGQISIQFLAPRFSGTYSSIWKFVHNGHQFGQCLSFMIVVDSACLPEVVQVMRNEAVQSPRSVKTKAQEDISSEDDESSCDDHSDDFVVIPSSFQDKVPRSNCSDGSIEILNPTPTGNSTPSKVWEFSQNGPGVYRTEEGDLISLETPVRRDSTPTNGESTPINMASLQKDAVIVVDEIGRCIISSAKDSNPPPSAPNPSTFSSSSSSSSTFTSSFPNPLSFAAELRTQISSQQPAAQSHCWASASFAEQAARFAAEHAAKGEAEFMTRSGSDKTDATAADQTAMSAAELRRFQDLVVSAAMEDVPQPAEQMAKSAAEKAAEQRRVQNLAEHAARVAAQRAAQNAAEQAVRAARSASEQATRAASVASAVRNIAADVAACESNASGNISANIQNVNTSSIPELVNTCATHAASAAQNVVTSLLAQNNGTAAANIPQLVNSCVPHATAAAQTVVTNLLGHNAATEVVNTCASHAASAAQNVMTNLLAHNAALNAHRTTTAGDNDVTSDNGANTRTGSYSYSTSTSNSNDSNGRGNGEINVNEIINLCTAQAASTAQNIISGLLNNRDNTQNFLNTAASAAQNVMGGFMSMSNTSSTSEANTQTSMHANAQTNTQAHAQTNTQNNTGTNTQSNAQTNTTWTNTQSTNAGGPEEFAFSAASQNNMMPNMLTQSVTEILSTILAGARTQQNNSQQNSASPADTAQFGVYSNYPQSRSSSQSGTGNVFVQHPQARPPPPSYVFTSSTTNDANSRIYPTLFTNPVPPSAYDSRLFTYPTTTESANTNRLSHRTTYPNWRPKVHKMRGVHSTNQGQGQRGPDQTNLISSALISSDNSDSGHLSNNSKAKKKAVRKSIKLDRNYARNKIHHRKKDHHSGCGIEASSRLDPTIWIDLTKRLEDLAVTPSDTTRATTSAAEPSSAQQNLSKTSRRSVSGAAASMGNVWSLRPDVKNMVSTAAAPAPVPKQSPTRLSAETFVNPIAFSNFPSVPTHTSPILTTTNNTTTGVEPPTSSGANSTRLAAVASENSGTRAMVGNSTRVADTTSGRGGGYAIRNSTISAGASTSSPDVGNQLGDKMAQLVEMGYTDKKLNRKTLEECGFNVDAAIHKLGDLYATKSKPGLLPTPEANSRSSPPAGTNQRSTPAAPASNNRSNQTSASQRSGPNKRASLPNQPRPAQAPILRPGEASAAARGGPMNGFERELDNMVSHLMDMGFGNLDENMQVLARNNFVLTETVFELVALREQEAEREHFEMVDNPRVQAAAAAEGRQQAPAPRPGCTGH